MLAVCKYYNHCSKDLNNYRHHFYITNIDFTWILKNLPRFWTRLTIFTRLKRFIAK